MADYSIQKQLEYSRVRQAKAQRHSDAQSLFEAKGLKLGGKIFMRIFKHEDELELWSEAADGKYRWIKTYEVCMKSGALGPKRQEGDRQVPEGFYRINRFNPNSSYHLSMMVNYPNKSDQILTTNRAKPGGLIFIHGACATIGCVPLGDAMIEELYWITLQAHDNGQAISGRNGIPVHIFPARMNSLAYRIKRHLVHDDRELLDFWSSLEAGFDFFDQQKRIPQVKVNRKGAYELD